MRPDSILSESLLSPVTTLALIETWLDRLLPPVDASPEPLHRAMRYAVFSGGKRLRPQLLLQVAQACGIEQHEHELELALRAACAVELVHIASLVHDDLPCFDDAATRRGRPTVHVLFGEAMAVLVGDALLAHGVEVLTSVPRALEKRALRLVRLLVAATGSRSGLIGGQGLEQVAAHSSAGTEAWCSPELIERYHGMKTGVLFGMAAEAAAVAAGSTKTAAWAAVGQLFGRCYQLAHDLTGVRGRAAAAQKLAAAGAGLGPPNAVLSRGEQAVLTEMEAVLAELRKRATALAANPTTLLAFVAGLHDNLLHGADSPPTPAS